jgi:hypothetical protein
VILGLLNSSFLIPTWKGHSLVIATTQPIR